jgi:hypothetical protein
MDDRLREALRFLLLGADDRAAAAEAAVGLPEPPPFLDDAVMNEARRRGFVELRLLAAGEDVPAGAMVATDGNGQVAVGDITVKGRAWVGGQ